MHFLRLHRCRKFVRNHRNRRRTRCRSSYGFFRLRESFSVPLVEIASFLADDPGLVLDCLFFQMLQRFPDRGAHFCGVGESDQWTNTAINCDFGFVAVLLDAENNFGVEFIVQNLADFRQPSFNFLAIGGSNFVVPASVFHIHGVAPAFDLLIGKSYFFTLLWCVLGILMSSRYFATVRRVTWIPCDWRIFVICSSVSGFEGSSSSISFFTRRFRISSDVFPPSGPFTLSLKQYR